MPAAFDAPRDPSSTSQVIPRWNLADLYAGPDDPALTADLETTGGLAAAFRADYAERLASLSGAELGQALACYEDISERLNKVLSYAQLVFAGDMGDPANARFLQSIQERFNAITTDTLFFCLELNRIDDATLAYQLEDPATGRYSPWLRDSRVFRPHQLSDEVETVIHEKSVVGRNAWVRLFEQTIARMRFTVDGATSTLSDALNRLSHPDGEVRRMAAHAIGNGFGDEIELFALITNTLAKEKEVEDRLRHYPTPTSFRNLSNRVEDDVVDALVEAVQASHEQLSHRYYAKKACWFGRDVLDYWDRNAPLPGGSERHFSWAEAKESVLTAFGRFDPRLAEIAERFFQENWIDATPGPGKDPGAFAHPTVPSAHPFILLNFYGRPRDVMTLAHELGHGVHQILAGRQGLLMSDTPLTLAETASVFGEMLVFRDLIDGESDPDRRRRMLAGKVEDMLNTVVRQIAFFNFEKAVHRERVEGELSSERLGEIWLRVQSESLGPAFRFTDEYRHYWAYVPHFVHSPFYVYAYAFGDCLVNSLYQVYQEGMPGFCDEYIELLTAGGTLRHRELLAPFGLNASDPAFWQRGLNVIGALIDELEGIG